MISTAVIIAGGKGSRLNPLTRGIPKALVPIRGQPMLYWVAKWLKANHIRKLVVGVAYKKEKIIEYLRRNDNFGIDVRFSEHTVDGGTSQGFRLAIQRYVDDDVFLAMNCDEITNLSVANLEMVHRKRAPLVTMALAPFQCRFSVVELDPRSMISGFRYGQQLNNVLVSIGVYVFSRELLKYLPKVGSIEDLVFARLSRAGKMAAYALIEEEEWTSVNDLKDLVEAEKKLEKFYPERAGRPKNKRRASKTQ